MRSYTNNSKTANVIANVFDDLYQEVTIQLIEFVQGWVIQGVLTSQTGYNDFINPRLPVSFYHVSASFITVDHDQEKCHA